MFCPSCGRRQRGEPNYCYHCGQALPPTTAAAPSDADLGNSESVVVPWRVGQVTIGIVLVILAILLVSVVAHLLGTLAGKHETPVAAWVFSHLLGLAVIVVVWRLGLKRYRVPVSSLGLTLPGLPGIRPVLLTIGVFLAGLAFNVIYAILVNLIDSDFLSPDQDFSDIVFPGLAGVFTFQALALWTPLTEEVFFRGFVFAGLVPSLGVRWAIVASALIFSAFHITQGTVAVLLPIFILGLLLAWLYQRTGSLWSSIAAHAGQNTVALVVTIYGG